MDAIEEQVSPNTNLEGRWEVDLVMEWYIFQKSCEQRAFEVILAKNFRLAPKGQWQESYEVDEMTARLRKNSGALPWIWPSPASSGAA